MPVSQSEITRLLKAWSDGETDARDQLIPLVVDELRRIARYQLDRENPGHTLQPTAIVNELYLKLVDQKSVQWNNRRDFFAIAAKLIRRILVDHARKRRAAKRGSGEVKVAFDEALGLPEGRDPSLIALDDGMDCLARIDPRGSRVVELHVFAGLKFEEIAEVLAISRSTVIRDWNHARLWLRRELTRE
ncbi:MAG TPA: sigma-70 family RNA polymerase sigma factor [Thermoanaerobaculia bacterium]|jgi:RNA polymerase sigma factor (TIGR02999 family)